ncbi:MAG: GIY-YIG nuclease family protein [Chloroflexi bacterium]|nr:GIY-YIG nuclease family protein [Chloroflexota bacterium]
MIVLPAIPAIVAALTPIVQAAAVSAAIGGLFGAGAGAVGCGIDGAREHGEINHDVVEDSAHCAVDEGAKGALVGGALGPVIGVMAPAATSVIAPAAAPVINVVDDVAAHAIGTVDDLAKPVLSAADDIVRPVIGAADDVAQPALHRVGNVVKSVASDVKSKARPAIDAVDNAIRPVVNKVGDVANSVGGSITTRINWARNTLNARLFNRLPDASATERYVYVMDDAANGLQKIGMTTKKPSIRLTRVANDAKRKLDYVCIIRTDKNSGLEGLLHGQFAGQKTPHPTPNYKSTEWFALSAAQIAAACSY